MAPPDTFDDLDDCRIALQGMDQSQLKALKYLVEAYYHEEFDFAESVLSNIVVSAIKTYIDNELENNNDLLTEIIANKANVLSVLKKTWPTGVIKAELRKSVGICCFFSGGVHDQFMWNDYAGQHTGFCIEYEYQLCRDSTIRPVSYVSREHWNSDHQGLVVSPRELALCPEETFSRLVTTKDISFAKEKEYRFVEPKAFVNGCGGIGRNVVFPSYLKPTKAYTGMKFSSNSKDLQVQFKEAIRVLDVEVIPFKIN